MRYKLNSAIDKRIEWLGQLNDRRIRALAANDEAELERIAAEYESHHMDTMASEIRLAIRLRKSLHAEADK